MQTGGKLLGPARTASLLLNEAGVAGFYRGVLSPMVGTGVIKAAVFGGYGLCQGLVRRATGKKGKESLRVRRVPVGYARFSPLWYGNRWPGDLLLGSATMNISGNVDCGSICTYMRRIVAVSELRLEQLCSVPRLLF